MMRENIATAMSLAKSLGADFADIRVKDIRNEHMRVENGQLTKTEGTRSRGYGVRVYYKGAMGFAASDKVSEMPVAVQKAFNIARASLTLLKKKAQLDVKKPVQHEYKMPMERDPFEVPFEEKLALMMDCDAKLRAEGVRRTYATLSFRRDDVIFADTDGSYISQSFTQCTGNIGAVAFSDSDSQTRSFMDVKRAGWESILAMNLPERAETLGREAVELLAAEDCPSGTFDLVIMPRQMFLQIHESVGHPTELDRIMGSEAAFAGRSFVETEDIDTLNYGSEHVNIVADATCATGLGTFAYDDEGVPAQNVALISQGVLTGLQTCRDYASAIKQNSTGAGLSDGWENLPIVRMTNINMLPGDATLDELIGGIDYGFVFDENKSWSIDDLRINFQFACQVAREIRDGKLTGKIFKNPIYSGKTTEFWASCDGVANEDFWELVGVPNCGKGQPMQVMRVSHGSSPTRFRSVKVGVEDVK
jgi:TldD protein